MGSRLSITMGMQVQGINLHGECIQTWAMTMYLSNCRGTAGRVVELVKRALETKAKL